MVQVLHPLDHVIMHTMYRQSNEQWNVYTTPTTPNTYMTGVSE